MSYSSLDRALVIALVVADLAAVVALMRVLALDPAPAFFGGSLRRQARRLLRPTNRKERWKVWKQGTLERLRPLGVLAYLLAGAALALPVSVDWGPLATAKESVSYLQTLWVVVAASLGFSVAMIAFAFEAFMSSGRRVHGGTLREFAAETRLQGAIRLGILALVINGLVLFKIGHGAPAGWAGAWAILLSAATLLAVPYVVSRVVTSLDERQLLRMRRRRVEATVHAAMRHQLIQQAAEVVLQRSSLPIERAWIAPHEGVSVDALTAGEVDDVKLGKLARVVVGQRRRGQTLVCQLRVMLGNRVDASDSMIWLRGPSSDRLRRRVRRTVTLRSEPDDRADLRLLDQLAQLHQQAIAAVRAGQEEDWRQVSEIYELVLLALPRAAASWGVAFAGAVAAPGFFGVGPLQRIERYLYEEVVVAVDSSSRELVGAISYFPSRIATEATRLGATAVAQTMVRLYPAMYRLAQEKSE